MARTERYVTIVELNSQQAQDRLKELEAKVKDLRKAKEEATRDGRFFDEKELKKATKEFNAWKAQIEGVKGTLEHIGDVSMGELEKTLRKLRQQSKGALPGTDEFDEIQHGIMVVEERIKQLKNGFRENKEEAERLTAAAENMGRVFRNINGASLNDLLAAQKFLEENISKMNPESATLMNEQLKQVKARIAEIKAEQQQVLHQIDRYDQEIKASAKDMATVKRETALVNATLQNLSTSNVRDLEYSIKIINEQLREMPRGTAEFDRMQEKAKKLRTELEQVRYEGAAQQSLLSRTADFFNKIQGAAIAAVGAITGLTFTIRRCVEAFAQMDQEMEDVRKYTGQTKDQVVEMNEEFKNLDTRTARERLNQLAGDAGRLGIQGQQAIMEFVDAADKINVALGDDLGEGAVKNIGKLAMSFGTDKTMGLRGAMLATGSAVNELAQNSSASASYLVDFTARVAGFGKQVGLTQTQIMGFGAVMDENMLRDEMAATAFGQLLVKMTTDLDTFAKLTGMKVEEYKKLVTEDINGAILAVAKSLKGRDMQDLGQVFDAMNLDGQRAIGVLSTLGDKVNDVAERQRIANDAYEQGVSIIEEFNIQNNTVQAGLEKAQKHFHDLTIELGEKLMPIARYGITTGSMLVKSLSALISFVEKYAVTIVSLTTVIAACVAWETKDVAIKKLQVFWNEKVLVSLKRLWVVAAAHPFAAFATVMTLVIGLIVDFRKKTDSTAEAMRKLNKNRDESKKKAAEERQNLELLISASKNEKLSLDERLKAIDKLQKQIPGYITELDKETGKYKENKKALDDYIRSLEKKYELEGAKEMLADLGKEIAEATVKVNEAKAAADRAGKAGPGTTYTTSYGSVGNTTEDLKYKTQTDLSEANKVLQDKLKEREKILSAYGVELQKEAATAEETEQEIVQNSPTQFTNTKAQKAAEAAAKKQAAAEAKALRERNQAVKAEIESELAMLTNSYAKGEIDYRTFVEKRDKIMIDGYNRRMALYEEESNEYKQLLNDREQYALKSSERQERMSLRDVEREHHRVMAGLESRQWTDEGELFEAMHQADIEYLQKKAELYRKGSEERVEIEEQIEDMEYQHRLDSERRYREMLQEVQEQYLNMGNQQQLQVALNGLDELHRQGLIKEEEYQRAKIAIEAQYASNVSPTEQIRQTGSQMLTNASNNVNKEAKENNTTYSTPFAGAVQEYRATMEQLKILYANDSENYAAYQQAKAQCTSEFLADISSQFQTAWNSINGILSASTQLFSAEQEIEIAAVKKKYEKQLQAAGNNQKRQKKIQEKQAKEEAAIKNKYNQKAVKIQIAQAIASTALSAINAYASAAQVPMIGYILAPIAAAAAAAAGMIQVAAIQKQAQAQQAGYYEGGFTGGRRYRREAGVVHEGEFVANHRAVNNPQVRPMLEFIDNAQRNNTVGSLTADDISRQLGKGEAQVVAPIVNVSTDNEELRQSLDESREVNSRLLEVIENDGIKVNFPMDSFNREYNHFKKLNDR